MGTSAPHGGPPHAHSLPRRMRRCLHVVAVVWMPPPHFSCHAVPLHLNPLSPSPPFPFDSLPLPLVWTPSAHATNPREILSRSSYASCLTPRSSKPVPPLPPRVCNGSCPHSRRGITPSENPAQDAERDARATTRSPGSLGAKRSKTTEVTQAQRRFIRTRTMTPKHTLIYPQKQDAGRAQSRPPGATMGGPVPNGRRSQARASSGPCPASLTAPPLEWDPRPSRAEAGKSLRLPIFQNLPKTNTSGLISSFSIFPDRIPVGFYPWSRSYLGPAYARIAEASTSFPVPPEGPDSGRRVAPLCVSDPSRGARSGVPRLTPL